MAQQGMFSGIFREPEDETLRENRALARARLSPVQSLQLAANEGAGMAGRGLAQAVGGALGVESPEDNRRKAAVELRALSANPASRAGTREFYTQAIAIASKYGLVAEAAKFQEALTALAASAADIGYKNSQTAKNLRGPDPKEVKVEKFRQMQLDLKRARADGEPPEVIEQLVRNMKNFLDGTGPHKTAGDVTVTLPGGGTPPYSKGFDNTSAINKWLRELKTLQDSPPAGAPGAVHGRDEYIQMYKDLIQNARDASRNQVEYNAAEAEQKARKALDDHLAAIQSHDKGTVEASDKVAAKADLKKRTIAALEQVSYGFALDMRTGRELLAMPGLDGILGGVYGRAGSILPESTAAQAKYDQVKGQTFIRALNTLKAASKDGSSGLGQLTEVEGGKIEAAFAGIGLVQPLASFKWEMAKYLATLKHGKEVGDKVLTSKEYGGTPQEAPDVPQPSATGPNARRDARRAQRAAPTAPSAPTVAPPSAPTVGSTREKLRWVVGADGKRHLEAAQ